MKTDSNLVPLSVAFDGGLGSISRTSGECPTHGHYETVTLQGRTPTCLHCASAETDRFAIAEVHRVQSEGRDEWITGQLGKSGLPERFLQCSFENYEIDQLGLMGGKQREAAGMCHSYATNFKLAREDGSGLILIGNPGTGKNHLAAAIVTTVVRAGFSALVTKAAGIVRAIRDGWTSKSPESEILSQFTDPDLLVIDEIGVDRGTEDERMHFFAVLDARYEAMKSTIFVGNLGFDGLGDVLGERVIDRMRERGGVVIEFSWESHRGKVSQPRWKSA